MELAMIHDEIRPFNELDPVYTDRGIFFGDGVYEVLRSYNGHIFALQEHLERFRNSLTAIEIEGIDINYIRRRVLKAFEQANLANAKIYFHITRGSGPRDHVWHDGLKPNFFLTVTELHSTAELKNKGVAVATHPDWRWKRCDIKSLNLLANVLARNYAAKKGCDEAILVNDNGYITEGAASAFFTITGNTIQTTPLSPNILPSITRQFTLKAARNLDMKLNETAITPEQAQQADEMFIAVTTKSLVPIVRFEGNTIGNGKPGKMTVKLDEEFMSFTR